MIGVTPPIFSADELQAFKNSAFATQTDQTSSRAIDGTVYQNTNKKTMHVVVSATTAGAGALDGLTDASTPPTTTVVEHDHAGAGVIHIAFMVLPGNYYLVNSSGAVLAEWLEWV